jgi:peptide deformylase
MHSVAFLFIWCIPNFAVVALLASELKSLSCRRKLLVNTLSGVAAAIVTTTVVPTVVAASAPAVAENSAGINELQQFELRGVSLGGSKALAAPLLSVESAALANTLGKLRLYPDPCLRRIASPVDKFGAELEKVADLLVAGMKSNATAAVQYGIDARIVVLKGSASPDSSPIVFVNPNILSRSSEDKMLQWREFCLVVDVLDIMADTNPTNILEIDLLRDEIVEVAAQDITGRPIRKALSGEAARAFQHELDHLDGILIIDHASLSELPASIAKVEAPYHAARQRHAFQRNTYQGNTPLYW